MCNVSFVFCWISFIAPYNSLNSIFFSVNFFFLSQLFEVVKNPRKRYREMSKSNRKKIGNRIFVRFVFHFYCAIETDLHAFNFYLVTSDLALVCSIVVHFQSIIILSLALRIFFSSLLSSLNTKRYYKSNIFPFYIEPSTIDIFSMNSILFYFVKLFRLKRQPFQYTARNCKQITNKKMANRWSLIVEHLGMP